MKDTLIKYQISASQENDAKQLVDVAKVLLFSIFSHERFFVDFNDNAKRQREVCEIYIKRIVKILNHSVTRQNQKHVILLNFLTNKS
jgi:hypothetical protein